MNVVAMSLMDVCIFGAARSERRTAPWLQRMRTYDGEIDLGFGGALRMAATVLTRDPIFDWFAFGGSLTVANSDLQVIPRD